MNKEYVISKLAQYTTQTNDGKTKKTTTGNPGYTGISENNTWKKDGKYHNVGTYEFDTPNGKRHYTAVGTSGNEDIARDKSKMNAFDKIMTNPSDSTTTMQRQNLKAFQKSQLK